MIVKPVFDEMRDFWGKYEVDYSKESETDLHWWALKLDFARSFLFKVLNDLKEPEGDGAELKSILLKNQTKAEAIEQMEKIQSEISWELQQVGEARAK